MRSPETPEQNPEIFPGTSEEDESLDMGNRFGIQREGVVDHYVNAYLQIPNASKDPIEVAKGIREFIEDKGLFAPTAKDKKGYDDPTLSDNALKQTIGDWKKNTVKEVLRTLRSLGKIDEEKEKTHAA
jgi:hypothetical protein